MRTIELNESLVYILLRLCYVLIAFVIAAFAMTFARVAEANGFLPPDTSQVGSTIYFHVASFGLLWLLLRRPVRWERSVVVGIWLVLDYCIWVLIASFDGREFLPDYIQVNAVSTLQHRYCFIGLTVLTVILAIQFFSHRIYSIRELRGTSEAGNAQVDRQPVFSLRHLFVLITYVAIGAAIARLAERQPLDAQVGALEFYLYNFTLAAWSVSRGAVLWLIALFCLGTGRVYFAKLVVVLSVLLALDVLLVAAQSYWTSPPMNWTFYTPYSSLTFGLFQQYLALGLTGCLLTFGSVLVIRLLGYEFVAMKRRIAEK